LLATEGQIEEAEGLAREAVSIAAETDLLNFRADSLLDFAEVLRTAGRAEEAPAAAAEAVCVYEKTGNVVAARNAAKLVR
jgi:hypothetical protein